MLIQELQLHTTDLVAQKSFYSEVLACQIVAETADKFTVQTGNSLLTFQKTHLVGQKPCYHFAFNVPSNQINDAFNWLKSRNIDVLPTAKNDEDDSLVYIANFDEWQADAVYFHDPAGNIVEFIARQEFARPSAKPFSAESIVSISEIAVVAVGKDAKQYAAELREKYDITSFQKGSNTLEFWALGADNGLVLVVRENRIFFPTQIPAARFPLKVLFENRKNIDCELEIF